MDYKLVFDFIFSSTDFRVFESYSEPDQQLHEFKSFDQLASIFPIGDDPHGNVTAVLLQLWSPSVMQKLTIERFGLDPKRCQGHTFRHRIAGGGLFQLYLGGIHSQIITK